MGDVEIDNMHSEIYINVFERYKCELYRLVRFLCEAKVKNGLRWQASALAALHEASEAYLIHMMSCANLAAIHAKRVTLQRGDIHLVRCILGKLDLE